MRLSRGRSTPTRRAIDWPFLEERSPSVPTEVSGRVASPTVVGAPASAPEVIRRPEGRLSDHVVDVFSCVRLAPGLALALLVARVLADHHDAAVATDHL